MRSVALKLSEFFIDEDGPTTTEYAVMLGLVIVVALAAIGVLGHSVSGALDYVSDCVAGDGGGNQQSGGGKTPHPLYHGRHLMAR
jgi:Flp pilus assembly pilin Flp